MVGEVRVPDPIFHLTAPRTADAVLPSGKKDEAILPAGTLIRVLGIHACEQAPAVECYDIEVCGSHYIVVANHLEAAFESLDLARYLFAWRVLAIRRYVVGNLTRYRGQAAR